MSGRTIAIASYILGNSRQTPPKISLSIEMKGGLLGRVRRNTLICCLKVRISAASATRDRSRSITIPMISLHKSNIEQQHRPILDQPPAGWGLRQGQAADRGAARVADIPLAIAAEHCDVEIVLLPSDASPIFILVYFTALAFVESFDSSFGFVTQ